MKILLRTCPVGSILQPEIDDMAISPLIDYELSFGDFLVDGTNECNYEWSYEAYYEDMLIETSSLSEDVIFDASLHKFYFNMQTGGMAFTITIKGIFSDLKTTAETEFQVTVAPIENNYIIEVDEVAPRFISLKQNYNITRLVDEAGNLLENKATRLELGDIIDRDQISLDSALSSDKEEDFFVFD